MSDKAKKENITVKVTPSLKDAFTNAIPDTTKRNDALRTLIRGLADGSIDPDAAEQSSGVTQELSEELSNRLQRVERSIQGLATAIEAVHDKHEEIIKNQERQTQEFQHHVYAFLSSIIQNHHELFPDKSKAPHPNEMGQIVFHAFEQAQKDIERLRKQ